MEEVKILTTTYRIDAPFGMKAAVLADFHNSDPGRILDMLSKADKPDIILIPGDVVLGYYPEQGTLVIENSANILPFLRSCCEIAPVYMSLGNHECLLCDEDIRLLKSTGIRLLDNEWVYIPDARSKVPVMIGGLTSGHVISYRRFRDTTDEKYPERRRPRDVQELRTESLWLDDYEKQEGYKILLSHHPEYWSLREPFLKNRRFDLVLSGHAHGGQWRIFGHGVFAPGQGIWPRYTEGIHTGPYGQLIISRGLANPYSWIPRWGNPCELIYLEFGKIAQ